MNKFIVLFSLLFATVVSLKPEKAADQFIKSYIKHVNDKDAKIVDKDFYIDYKSTGKKISRDEFVEKTFGPKSAKARDHKDYPEHADSFNEDGLLEMKFYNGSALDSYTLAKSDKDIEGGYKLYRIVVV